MPDKKKEQSVNKKDQILWVEYCYFREGKKKSNRMIKEEREDRMFLVGIDVS